jgi:4-hydroxybenzoate polyprenyltransferase
MLKVNHYTRLLRFPGLGGLAIPPVIGAITVNQNLDFINLLILFIIGSLSSIYGFVLNDYADIEIDKLSKDLHSRPLVNGSISPKTAIGICFFSLIFAFLLIFILFYGKTINNFRFASVIIIILASILGSIYNFYGKKIAGSDLIVSLSVSFVFLFGALSVGYPNILTWIIFILTFNNLLHMNAVEGGIKDSDHDYKFKVKNFALLFGVKFDKNNIFIPFKFKVFSISIRIFSAFLLLIPFLFYSIDYFLWQIIFLIFIISGVLYFSIKLLSIKIFDRNIIRKYISIQSFLRYSLVPIMLISTIGMLYSLILIIFPIIWYILFTPLLGERLLRPKM